jgi:hypothetical protein
MIVGDRLQFLREGKSLPQGDIEKKDWLVALLYLACRNGDTVAAVERLEKLARALEVPRLSGLYEGQESPKVLTFPKKTEDGSAWGSSGRDAVYLNALADLFVGV